MRKKRYYQKKECRKGRDIATRKKKE